MIWDLIQCTLSVYLDYVLIWPGDGYITAETCCLEVNYTVILSFLYRASFQHMQWKPTDVTILFVYCWISTCFGPTGPSSGEFVQLFTQPLVQYLYCSIHMLSEHANRAAQKLNQWLCEQLYELSWRWACGPETCRDPAIYEQIVTSVGFHSIYTVII